MPGDADARYVRCPRCNDGWIDRAMGRGHCGNCGRHAPSAVITEDRSRIDDHGWLVTVGPGPAAPSGAIGRA